MSHTPGPWQVAENLFGNTANYEVYTNVKTKSGKGGYTRICQVTPRDQKTNAHLIAAAPDLLRELERLENQSGLPLERDDPARVAARTAIRKARGEK